MSDHCDLKGIIHGVEESLERIRLKSLGQHLNIRTLKSELKTVKDDKESMASSLIDTHNKNQQLEKRLASAEKILSELNDDFKSMQHSYVGRGSTFHENIKKWLKENR